MAFRVMPEKRFRLYDGTPATEYEAVSQSIKMLKQQQQSLEDKIELLQIQLQTAEGRPPDV